MKPVVDFINCLGKVFDTMGLAADGHAGLMAAMEAAAYDALCLLLKKDDELVFYFVDGEVIFAHQRVQGPFDGEWTRELPRAGVERVEISQGVTREEFGGFIDVLLALLSFATGDSTEQAPPLSQAQFPHIRFGQLDTPGHESTAERTPHSPLWLQEEIEATEWLLGQAARGERISRGLAWTITKSLYGALRDGESVLGILVSHKDAERYTATHSVNAALLVMAMFELFGRSLSAVRAAGEAAVLHDVGQVRVPDYIVGKPGKLSPKEWDIVKRHPTEGARMLLDSGPGMDLAATVAFEHHLGYDGSGYPALHYRRTLHPATQALHVADIYDALRTRRPFRDPWSPGQIKAYLQAESGRSLYPGAVQGLTRILDQGPPGDGGRIQSMG
jgi:HD-GYP domain-containing protein (c-di-GMP phosphodiesterase class II)